MFALTTAWNITATSDITQSLQQIKELGFDSIEAGYNLAEPQLDQVVAGCEKYHLDIVSVHNFCPLPPPPTHTRHYCDYYRLSSLDNEERAAAVRSTKKTIDTAKRMKSPPVIIHAGMVEIDHRQVKQLLRLYRHRVSQHDEYDRLKKVILEERAKICKRYLDTFRVSLKEILDYAAANSITIALENRYYPQEIPSLDEFVELFDEFAQSPLKYWHDTGHAVVSGRIGIVEPEEYLRRFSSRLAGMHLHDVKGIDDHWAPFSQEVDFSQWEPYFKDNTLPKIIESHPQATADEVRFALKKLREMER
ncbi:MAG: sugar phosphate isomerase/epimerase [Candidatus Omnitrophica bacterium]|nr:sugar phosphate isomerase/epimerase [Candidatus Omnitrophota bacterium]